MAQGRALEDTSNDSNHMDERPAKETKEDSQVGVEQIEKAVSHEAREERISKVRTWLIMSKFVGKVKKAEDLEKVISIGN